jgi:hypothetical protein
MSNPPRVKPGPDRRPPAIARERTGSFDWVRKALGGHLGLERRGRQLHVVLHERRKAPVAEAGGLQELRDELRVRLFDLDGEHHAAHAMRHLILVHDELGRHGWNGVEALPAPVIAKALVQAEMLASDEPSAPLALIVERLALLKAGAEAREGLLAEPETEPSGPGGLAEVSETNYDEYELMERSWAGTVPAGLQRPDRTL